MGIVTPIKANLKTRGNTQSSWGLPYQVLPRESRITLIKNEVRGGISLCFDKSAELKRPLEIPDAFKELISFDPEGELIEEEYTSHANCVAYVLMRFPSLLMGGEKWFDVCASTENVRAIKQFLTREAKQIQSYKEKEGEARELFSARVEEEILKDGQIKKGDILSVYVKVGKKKRNECLHMGILEEGKQKRLCLEGKFYRDPIFRASIKRQVFHYIDSPYNQEIEIVIYRPNMSLLERF